MKARMKNVRITLALAAAIVIGTTAFGVLTAYDLRSEGTTEAITLFDPYNDLEVAGTSDDVFHGTVLERTADEISDRVPTEFYRVEVGETFKGKLSGAVTVAQTIGSRPSLTPGAKYLFTTSMDRDGRTHFVLAEVTLRKTPDLDAAPPADRPAAAQSARTVRDYWRWVVAHEVDVSTQPPGAP
jgi:hypothetical protein